MLTCLGSYLVIPYQLVNKSGQMIIVNREGSIIKQLQTIFRCCHGNFMEETHKVPQGSQLSVQNMSLLNKISLYNILSEMKVNMWTRLKGLRIVNRENVT
jgi:hypothetical protein